jgi:serine/threonine-protein kinase
MGDLDAMVQDLKKAAELNPQFEPVYHDAAAAYGVDLPSAANRPQAPPPPAPLAPRKKQFLVILASSIMGGILIAVGFLHVFGMRWARPAPPPLTVKIPPPKAVRDVRAKSGIDGSYAVGRALGHGGMGVVYEAVDRALGRKVAIKMLLDEYQIDPKAKEQLLEEARTVAALHHPNIVDIHSIVSDEKGLYLVFEFIEGDTVAGLLTRKGRLTLAEAQSLLKPVCAALDFAHRRNVVHRDLKPANIMITDQGLVKVMDFGISRRIKDTMKEATDGGQRFDVTNSVVGTPYYMAPEQEYGVVRPESDVYSLGTCLYEMVTGSRPYPPPASHFQKISGHYVKPSVLEASLPRSFDVLIDGALHPDPEKRIRTVADFWNMLDVVRESDTGILPS